MVPILAPAPDDTEKVAQGIAGVSEIDNRIISVPSR